MSRLKCLHPENDMYFRGDITVYLIHLYEPIGRSQHYLGSTEDIETRLRQHRKKRTYYKLTASTITRLSHSLPYPILDALTPLRGRKFLSKLTIIQAVRDCIGQDALTVYQLAILKAARKSKGSALLQEANRRGIEWTVAVTWHANRNFESWLKGKKQGYARNCPLCHGVPC